jgi:hypothetical protein
VNPDTIIMQVQRYTLNLLSREVGTALGGDDQGRLGEHLEAVNIEAVV